MKKYQFIFIGLLAFVRSGKIDGSSAATHNSQAASHEKYISILKQINNQYHQAIEALDNKFAIIKTQANIDPIPIIKANLLINVNIPENLFKKEEVETLIYERKKEYEDLKTNLLSSLGYNNDLNKENSDYNYNEEEEEKASEITDSALLETTESGEPLLRKSSSDTVSSVSTKISLSEGNESGDSDYDPLDMLLPGPPTHGINLIETGDEGGTEGEDDILNINNDQFVDPKYFPLSSINKEHSDIDTKNPERLEHNEVLEDKDFIPLPINDQHSNIDTNPQGLEHAVENTNPNNEVLEDKDFIPLPINDQHSDIETEAQGNKQKKRLSSHKRVMVAISFIMSILSISTYEYLTKGKSSINKRLQKSKG